MQDLYKNHEEVLRVQAIQIDSLKHKLDVCRSSSRITEEVMPEMKVLFPFVEEASCSNTYIMKASTEKQDTVMLVYLKCKDRERINAEEKKKIREWLSARAGVGNVKLLIE